MAEGDQNQNSAVSTQSDSTIVEVSFYAADGTLIQKTGYQKGHRVLHVRHRHHSTDC